jgi:hypothetical protein
MVPLKLVSIDALSSGFLIALRGSIRKSFVSFVLYALNAGHETGVPCLRLASALHAAGMGW